MLKFIEYLNPEERKLMKFLIANAKNALIESRIKNVNNKPSNDDILLFAGNILHEIVKIEWNEKI